MKEERSSDPELASHDGQRIVERSRQQMLAPVPQKRPVGKYGFYCLYQRYRSGKARGVGMQMLVPAKHSAEGGEVFEV